MTKKRIIQRKRKCRKLNKQYYLMRFNIKMNSRKRESLYNQLQSNIDLTGFNVVAISEAVAQIFKGVELGELVISKKPDLNSMQEATLAILRRLIKFDGSTS